MGNETVIGMALKREKMYNKSYNKLFKSWDLKSEKVVFVFMLKLRLLNSFIKVKEDCFLSSWSYKIGSRLQSASVVVVVVVIVVVTFVH